MIVQTMHNVAPLWLHFLLATTCLIFAFAINQWVLRSHIRIVQVHRKKLPANITAWRHPKEYNGLYLGLWSNFEAFFQRHGFTLWRSLDPSGITLCPPVQKHPSPDGFVYTAPCRVEDSLQSLRYFPHSTGLSCPARGRDGRDVIIRVITAGGQGKNHLKILRMIAAGVDSLRGDNHVLPMIRGFQYHDIVFGVFPRIAVSLDRSVSSWPKNSVEDVLDMFMQALEGVIFIHERGIAHRDLFLDNFLLEWHPESLRSRIATRPRVYLIDFETAVTFPKNSDPTERLVTGLPFPSESPYERPSPPELMSAQLYCLFLLDVWQLGKGFENFRSTQQEIDNVMEAMRHDEPCSRPTPADVLDKVNTVTRSIPLLFFHIEPPQ